MDGWCEVAKAGEIPVGQCRAVIVNDRMVAVINLDGIFYAIDNICTHDYAELCDGMIIGDRIQCPLHGAQFCIRTGAVLSPPAYEALHTYEVRISQGTIQVKAV
jgi:3-phenylpropionate/trans-cinnamate dioxygenase ferredoxin component